MTLDKIVDMAWFPITQRMTTEWKSGITMPTSQGVIGIIVIEGDRKRGDDGNKAFIGLAPPKETYNYKNNEGEIVNSWSERADASFIVAFGSRIHKSDAEALVKLLKIESLTGRNHHENKPFKVTE